MNDLSGFAAKSRRDPAWWCETVLGVDLWDGQVQIMESVRKYPRTAVKACHAPGKTFSAACLALWFLTSFRDSIVITTAPTWRQVEDVLWREIRSLHARSNIDLGGEFFKSPSRLVCGEKWYGIGLSPNEPEAFAGWHAPYVLVIVDEASGVPEKILGAIRGILMSGHVRLLLLGNPTKPEGPFYKAFHASRSLYSSITLSAFDTPNLMGVKSAFEAAESLSEKLRILREAPVVRKELISAAAVADMLEEFGEDSQIYRVRVMAEFPDSSPDALIELWRLEEAVRRRNELPPEMRWWEPAALENWTHPILMGLDPARKGDNLTTFAAQSQAIWADLQTYEQTEGPFLAGEAADFYHRHRAQEMRIDAHGMGGVLYDFIAANESLNPIEVTVGSPARDSHRFANLRAEGYWDIRQLAREGRLCIPDHQRLIGQLSSIKYDYKSGGQIFLESKDAMRSRGISSPDEADAVVLSHLVMPGGSLAGRAVGKAMDWNRMYG